jgi:hypothetical protein
VRTQQRQRGGTHLCVARERAAGYEGSEGQTGLGPGAGRALLAAVEGVAAIDVDELGEEELRARLGEVRRAVVRLEALQMRWNGVLETRALREAGPGREQQALRRVRDRTADELRLTPTEVKRSGETGRRLEAHPAAIEALATGDLPAEHARLLTDTLRWLDGEVRDRVETRLLEAARTQDARTFGRTCRRLLAEVDTVSAQTAEDRRRQRRSASVAQTPDGMTLVRAQLSGLDAEFVQTAVHAFRRPDAPGQRRRPEQRTADAFVEICRSALDAGTAPSNRNVRPHVLVTVDEPTVRDEDGTGSGVCETAWSGPLPWPEARRLLSDASVSRVLLDPAGLPTRAGEAVRTVPGGLWKCLQVRHRTCAGEGCSVPAAFGQVMHLDVPYRLEGRLDLDSSAPGCSFHHRMLDQNGWKVTWIDGRPVVHHPARPPSGHDPPPQPFPGPPPPGTDPPGTDPPAVVASARLRTGRRRGPGPTARSPSRGAVRAAGVGARGLLLSRPSVP